MVYAAEGWDVEAKPSLCLNVIYLVCRVSVLMSFGNNVECVVAHQVHLTDQVGFALREALDVGDVDARDDEQVDRSGGGAISEADKVFVFEDDVEVLRGDVAKDAFGRVDVVDSPIACWSRALVI